MTAPPEPATASPTSTQPLSSQQKINSVYQDLHASSGGLFEIPNEHSYTLAGKTASIVGTYYFLRYDFRNGRSWRNE